MGKYAYKFVYMIGTVMCVCIPVCIFAEYADACDITSWRNQISVTSIQGLA